MERATDGRALVKYMYYNEGENKEENVGSYYTAEPEKVLKLFTFAKENELEMSFNDYTSEIDERWLSNTYIVEDVTLQMETKTDLMVIFIYIV